jgi:hypothetical protein
MCLDHILAEPNSVNFKTQVFSAEAIVQLVGTHPRQYFTDRFNTFDITLVVANFITLCLEEMLTAGELDFVNPRMLRIVRVLRILRTLRAIRMLKSLRELSHITNVIFKSMGILTNLSMLLLLIFFAFGILGVALFSHLCSAPTGPGSAASASYSVYSQQVLADRCDLVDMSAYLSSFANFEHLGMAMLSLFRVSTRDLWSEVMFKYQLERPDVAEAVRREGIELAKKALFNYTQVTDPLAREVYLKAARDALPGCQTGEELQVLKEAQLLTCYSEPCIETCGTAFSLLYFPLFVSISSSILFNLITAVLMRELVQSHSSSIQIITPGLSAEQLDCALRVWRLHARIKRRMQRRLMQRFEELVMTEVRLRHTPHPSCCVQARTR